MFKSLKQFAKKLAGGSKRTRKVSQKGGSTIAERAKKANSYMKMLLLKQKEAENNKIAEMKAKRKNQNKKNLTRAMRAHKTKGTTKAIKPSNNVLEQYKSTNQPTQRAAVMWEGFDKKTMNNIRENQIAHNKTMLGNRYVHHNNRLAPRENQINEAERYNLEYSDNTSDLYLEEIKPQMPTFKRPLRKSFKGTLYESPNSPKSPTRKRTRSSSLNTSPRKSRKSSSLSRSSSKMNTNSNNY